MSPGLGLEQSQQLELTPEMRMGIEIMAMPVMELRALIANITMSNPFLKLDDGSLSHNADASAERFHRRGFLGTRRRSGSLGQHLELDIIEFRQSVSSRSGRHILAHG